MKIACISGTFPPYFGGIGNVCYHSAIELAKLGNDVTVFTSNFPKGQFSYPPLLKVKRLRYPFMLGKSPFLPGLLRVKDFDIVHLHHPFYFGSEMVYLSSKIHNFNYVLTYHMDVPLIDPSDPRGYSSSVIRFHDYTINKQLLLKAKKIIVTSKDYALNSRMKDIFIQRSEDLLEIPIGVDLSVYSQDLYNNANNEKIRKLHLIKKDAKIILFVGALDKQHYFKGVEYLLRAFSKLDPDNAILLIVGDGELKNYYVALATKLGINQKTIFTGRVPSVVPYCAVADLLVLPSTDMSEAFGLVLVEAMALGKPVIASNLPGVRTVVDDQYNGLLTKPKDVLDLASKISYLLKSDEIRALFGQRGRQKVIKEYSWTNIVLKLNSAFSELVNDRM
jgi:glycosyltransferase involved in cell wall biosynthesis